MKSLLLLEVGPQDFKTEYFRRVVGEQGVDTSVLINHRDARWDHLYHWQDEMLAAAGKDPLTRVIRADFRDIDDVLQQIEKQRVVAGKRFDGVATYMEEAVEATCQVQTALIESGLSIPRITSGSPEVLRSKHRFRKACEEVGLPQPYCHACNSLADAIEEALSLLKKDHCCIIKPDKMFYSKGVRKIELFDKNVQPGEEPRRKEEPELIAEIEAAYIEAQTSDFDVDPLRERFGIGNLVLVESYIDAVEEVSVEGIVHQGIYMMATPTAKYFSPEPEFHETGYIIPRPPNHNPNLKDNAPGFGGDLMRRVEEAVRLGAKAMKLENTVLHAECRINKDGKVVPVDFGARAPGMEIATLLDQATGVNLISQMVKLAVGKAPDSVSLRGRQIQYVAYVATSDRSALGKAQELSSKMRDELPAFQGIHQYPHEDEPCGRIQLAHAFPSEVKRACLWIEENIGIKI